MKLLRRAALLTAFALLTPAAGYAQDAELASVLDRVAAAWASGDAGRLANLCSRGGVALDLDNGAVGPVSPRQAAAALRKALSGRETSSLLVRSARVVGGQPPRAFGELTWLFRARGTTIPERTTVFLAFAWEEGEWRITQIRFLP